MQLTPSIARALLCGLLAAAMNPAGAAERAIITREQPPYPPLALQMHLHGDILLLVTVSASGKVTGVQVTSGHPILAAAALHAVQRWRFAPAAESAQVTVHVVFNLP